MSVLVCLSLALVACGRKPLSVRSTLGVVDKSGEIPPGSTGLPESPAATATPSPTPTSAPEAGATATATPTPTAAPAAVATPTPVFPLPGLPEEAGVNDGAWTVVFNAVDASATPDFWNIPYAQRLGQRGTLAVNQNFYDGAQYFTNHLYMEVIEDVNGKAVVAFIATATGIDASNMRLQNPVLIQGDSEIYGSHFAGGWSSPDFDDDGWIWNCSHYNYTYVTQHFGSGCGYYYLGGDPDPAGRGVKAPHLYNPQALGLASDGTRWTRVKRITRYAHP